MTLGELAVRFGCELRGDPSAVVDSVAALSQAGPRSITFLANPKYVAQLAGTRAGAVILDAKAAGSSPVLYRQTAWRHFATAMILFEAAGDERGVASTTDDVGKLHWLKGEYPQALVALRDGLTRRRKLKDRRSIALSLNNLGLALQDSGKFKEALESFEQALSIRREIGDLVGIVAQADLATKVGPTQPAKIEELLEYVSVPGPAVPVLHS